MMRTLSRSVARVQEWGKVAVKNLLKPRLLPLILLFGLSAFGFSQDHKVKSRVTPEYPELMRKMHMGGAVKVRVVIAPDGRVKEAQALGGHPMLISAATEAVKQWKFEPAEEQSTTVVELKFDPKQ
jgi:TonB family protein